MKIEFKDPEILEAIKELEKVSREKKNIMILFLCIGFLLAGCSTNENNTGNYYDMESVKAIYSGILANNQTFQTGESTTIEYDFDCPEYRTLVSKYKIDEIAGTGTEFERALNLMNEFAPRLTHESLYDNHIPINALDLLDYSLDNKEQGINCLSKAKILTEMCLGLGIYARRIFIMPYSPYDTDNHVVTEIYDTTLQKWIMLDPSNDIYFVDQENSPLSVLEIRDYASQNLFCTAVQLDSAEDLQKSNTKYISLNTYIYKNLFYFVMDQYNGFGTTDADISFYVLPEGFDLRKREILYYQFLIDYAKENNLDESYIINWENSLTICQRIEYPVISIDFMKNSPVSSMS